MRAVYRLSFAIVLLSITIGFTAYHINTTASAGSAFYVMPPAYELTTGTATFLGPLANAPRTYQYLIRDGLLTGLVGQEITAISFRLGSAAASTWPASNVTFTNYDIYLSASVTPASRSLTFASNIVGTQKRVRSGPLTITTGSYPLGGPPRQFGTEVTFDSTYLYTGGHLLIEIRHSGFTGTSSATDAIGTAITGYGTDFSACWVGNYTGVTGSQGNFIVTRLTTSGPLPVNLVSFESSITRNDIKLIWVTEKEVNNSGFDIERQKTPGNWEKIGFVAGNGTTNEPKNYTFEDKRLVKGIYKYRLKQIDYNGNNEYHLLNADVAIGSPGKFEVSQNYPNPSNPKSKIDFQVPFDANISVKVYDMLGREAAVLMNGFKPADFYTVDFDGSNHASGIYFYRVTATGGNGESFSKTMKMILVK